jgi:hypothetical protein
LPVLDEKHCAGGQAVDGPEGPRQAEPPRVGERLRIRARRRVVDAEKLDIPSRVQEDGDDVKEMRATTVLGPAQNERQTTRSKAPHRVVPGMEEECHASIPIAKLAFAARLPRNNVLLLIRPVSTD